MIINMYSILDNKAEAFLPPFFMQNDGLARRAIVDCIRDPKHRFSSHPRDYILFSIGIFDDLTGEIKSDLREIVHVISLVDADRANSQLLQPEQADFLSTSDDSTPVG
jgi:hypothetical protein